MIENSTRPSCYSTQRSRRNQTKLQDAYDDDRQYMISMESISITHPDPPMSYRFLSCTRTSFAISNMTPGGTDDTTHVASSSVPTLSMTSSCPFRGPCSTSTRSFGTRGGTGTRYSGGNAITLPESSPSNWTLASRVTSVSSAERGSETETTYPHRPS